jgi:probable F420-dependent oxidoreductase
VATGIVNVWAETPESVTRAWHSFEERYPGRLQVGLGISHAPLVKQSMDVDYRRPVATIVEFLDGLDAQLDPLPPNRRLLGAHGPKMLRIAAERTLGTHPYHVSTDNTALVRAGVGDALVAPELGVVLEPDLERARAIGRSALELYLGLPNYLNSWRRAGFTDADFAAGGSDRLVETLFALGDAEAIAARVAAHREAGADHVALQVLGDVADPGPVLASLANI